MEYAATGGNSNPYSNSKVNSPVKYPTNAAMINPGSNPSELIIFKTLDLLAKVLNGSEKVVIVQTTEA